MFISLLCGGQLQEYFPFGRKGFCHSGKQVETCKGCFLLLKKRDVIPVEKKSEEVFCSFVLKENVGLRGGIDDNSKIIFLISQLKLKL